MIIIYTFLLRTFGLISEKDKRWFLGIFKKKQKKHGLFCRNLLTFRRLCGILHEQSARWSSGQDASLSRWKRGFDSPTGHHNKTTPLGVAFVLQVLWGESNAAYRKQSGGLFSAVTEDFCKASGIKFAQIALQKSRTIPNGSPKQKDVIWRLFCFFTAVLDKGVRS